MIILPPLELLQERYYISEDSPSGLRNKIYISGTAKKDAVAGCPITNGYWQITINGTLYLVHRILYFLKTGEDPGAVFIDHRQGVNVNALDIRKATRSENGCNRGPDKGRKYKGVSLVKDCKINPWMAKITHKKEQFYLGNFATPEEAAAAYNEKALELHGEFAWLNILQ